MFRETVLDFSLFSAHTTPIRDNLTLDDRNHT